MSGKGDGTFSSDIASKQKRPQKRPMNATELASLEKDLAARIAAAADEAALEAERVAALGRKGTVSELMKGLGGMSAEERQVMGPALNGLKDRIGEAILNRRSVL